MNDSKYLSIDHIIGSVQLAHKQMKLDLMQSLQVLNNDMRKKLGIDRDD